jgi:D-beta-D-heptose 7-phosphate kinase / D-beta-D-heptose 1-phosphate adenosyltransferase
MDAAEVLIERDRTSRKRIAVIGDAMHDQYVYGEIHPCQDGCQKFVEKKVVWSPGGGAGGARELVKWKMQAVLFATFQELHCGELGRRGVVDVSFAYRNAFAAIKKRFVDENGRIVHRWDQESTADIWDVTEYRKNVLWHLDKDHFDAVLLCDYAKGLVDGRFAQDVIAVCGQKGIPVVADPRLSPPAFRGAVFKCNREYYAGHPFAKWPGKAVVTDGKRLPFVRQAAALDKGTAVPTWKMHPIPHPNHPVTCVNHVGAGDCFAAHLTLALAHGLPLEDATAIAHSAGRVYVQHKDGRPPWPHEIARDLDPAGGKVLRAEDLNALRQSDPGRVEFNGAYEETKPSRIVFTNGVFRLTHAGHAWFLRWAKSQGDVLVVGVNDDASAARQRPGAFVLPLAERLEILASMSCVDWLCAFPEDDPCSTIRRLKPDLLVKGSEYLGQTVPGADLVNEVRFAPASPFPQHSTDYCEALSRG